MHFTSVSFSEIGSRARNEDSFYENSASGVFVVADGLGGHNDGHIASALAIEVAISHIDNQLIATHPPAINDILEGAVHAAHCRLFGVNDAREKTERMATTITIAAIKDRNVAFSHIGDCRIFLINASIEQITTDHTMFERLRGSGVPAPSIGAHLDSVLTQCLGLSNAPIPQLGDISVFNGDRLVICSDGFYRSVTKSALLNYSLNSPNIEELRLSLLKQLQTNTPSDNATAIIVEIRDDDAS